ncbi:hypothetical protein K488DRAFT_76387 [Vararia minispora EC-137]|uniref:Uncharacterized protein n=1 Tax=Vararia minispora EC-137 TaxID=1314806 RepID=A0ACB8QVY8_9AGAM|nr:hypothetical protein K488DRAFT_76387 [Vararia minispora EC-137]
MIMVQKPVHLLSSPTTLHRRLPSAPSAVLVQPTRTPGLLALSKPAPTRQQQRQHQIRQPHALKAKGPVPVVLRPSPAPAESPKDAPASKDVAPSKDVTIPSAKDVPAPKAKVPAASTPNDKDTNNAKSHRGRQRSKGSKEKAVPRSASHSDARTGGRRRQPHHQGSPPQPSVIASQAEAKENIDRSRSLQARNRNQFDPFLSNSSDSDSDSPRSSLLLTQKATRGLTSEPKLASRPSGKLARRRQQLAEDPASPTPSRAVPVPRSKARPRDSAGVQLSRSAPGQAPIRARPEMASSDMFPICDDMTDVDEDERPPLTPTRSKGVAWQQQDLFADGPRTAPLSSTFVVPFFARATTPTPAPRRRPNHIRSPSEGVFNLSFEDDSSTSSGSEELKALVGLLPRRRIQSVTSTPPSVAKRASRPPNFFAASTFQNSPSPEDLPAPLF